MQTTGAHETKNEQIINSCLFFCRHAVQGRREKSLFCKESDHKQLWGDEKQQTAAGG